MKISAARGLVAALILCLGLILPEGAPAQEADATPLKFELKLPVGRQYKMKMTMDMDQLIKFEDAPEGTPAFMAEGMKQKFDMAFTMGYAVLQQRPDGGRVVGMTYDAIAMNMDMNNGMFKFDYDSSKPQATSSTLPSEADPTGMMGSIMSGMIGKTLTAHLNAKGEVEKVEGMEALMAALLKDAPPQAKVFLQQFSQQLFSKENYKQMFANANGWNWMPGREIAVGEKWSTTQTYAIPMISQGTQTMDMVFTGWEQQEGRKLAKIDFTSTFKDSGGTSDSIGGLPMGMKMKMNFEDADMNGTIYFDPELGLAPTMTFEQNMKIKMTMDMPRMPATTTDTQTTTQPETMTMRMDMKQRGKMVTSDLKGPNI